jgi:hypothetical protein
LDVEEDEEADVKPLIPMTREPVHPKETWASERRIQIEHPAVEQLTSS